MLEIENLRVTYTTSAGAAEALRGVNMRMEPREIFGIVGESGSGKSTLAWSILRLVPWPGRIVGGTITFFGQDLLASSEEELRDIRGHHIALISQATRSGLNPLFTLGAQIENAYRAHNNVTARAARERSLEMLERVSLPDPKRIAKSYPHEISGGMAQRVIIAIALICSPRLLIADEPTTGLDTTVQAQILDLLAQLSADFGTATMLVTHDLSVVAQYCARMVVLRDGEVVETGLVSDFFRGPQTEYGQKLLQSMQIGHSEGERTWSKSASST